MNTNLLTHEDRRTKFDFVCNKCQYGCLNLQYFYKYSFKYTVRNKSNAMTIRYLSQ